MDEAFDVTSMECFRDWSPAGATAQQQLSVVTTVWGVTTSTQSGPHGGFSGGPTPAGNPNYGSSLKQGQPNYQTAYRQTGPGYVQIAPDSTVAVAECENLAVQVARKTKTYRGLGTRPARASSGREWRAAGSSRTGVIDVDFEMTRAE